MTQWIRNIILLALLSVTGAQAASPNTFTLRLSGEPETLDWNRAHTPIETHLLVNLMDGLLAMDNKLKPTPALAESWKLSPNGRTYTFKLRPGVKWSDGVPLRAQDFVYSWKRLLTPETAAAYAYFLYDVEGAEAFNKGQLTDFNKVGIRALDDSTFQVTLRQPTPHWINIPTFWVTFPLREDVVKKHGSRWVEPNHMVTLGPYVLASQQLESKIVLKANPLYYGTRGNVEQIVGLVIQDDTTALNLYESGQVDFLIDISLVELKRWEGKPDLKIFSYLKSVYLGFVIDRLPSSNLKLRRAIAMGIDKSKLGDLLHKSQKPATSFVPPEVLGHFENIGFSFHPEKAKSELKASGIDLTKPVQLDLVLPNREQSLTVSQFIQSEIKKNLGLTVTLQPFDNKTYRSKLDLHTYPQFLTSWSGDYPDPDNFLSVFLSKSGNNRTGWKNSKFDELVIKARHIPNQKLRESIYFQMQKLLLEEDVVIVPLYYGTNWVLVKPRVQGLELNPLNYLNLRKVNVSAP